MKTQAWGWLIAGVLAAGLNASYHDGGLQWAHEVAERVGHGSSAVLALASGNAERFLSEAQLVAARNETASCRLSTALARVQARLARRESRFASFDKFTTFDEMTAEQNVQLAQFEANRDRMQARIQARVDRQMANIRIPAVAFRPVVVRVPQVPQCPRIRVNVPQAPMVDVQVPEIDVESGNGPI
jgi:hypothetical protein